MNDGAVIVDVAVHPGACVATIRPTTLAESIHRVGSRVTKPEAGKEARMKIRHVVSSAWSRSRSPRVRRSPELPGLLILGEKDLRELGVGLEHGVDYVWLAFVRWGEDVRAVRARIERLGGHAAVIAKIETQAALDHSTTLSMAPRRS
jgi:hypothetical protein